MSRASAPATGGMEPPGTEKGKMTGGGLCGEDQDFCSRCPSDTQVNILIVGYSGIQGEVQIGAVHLRICDNMHLNMLISNGQILPWNSFRFST